MKKALKRKTTKVEFVRYLQQITKRSGEGFREKTRDLSLDKVIKLAKKYE